jgi:phenylacetate-CoA ligase
MSDPAELDEIERASPEEVLALQLTRLRWSLGNAYRNCAAYRRKCEVAGVRPEDLKSLRDLQRFPFTTQEDLRASYPFGMFAVPRERVVRIQESSGTTGKPCVVGYTAHDVQTWSHVTARSIRAAGGRAGDVVHIALEYGLTAFTMGAHEGAELMGCMVVPASVAPIAKHVQVISDFEPDIIITTPSYLLAIAEELARQGLDPTVTSLRIAILGGEPWSEAMRGLIEACTGVSALNIYGLAEVMGLGVASECLETHDGAVVWEDHFYPEIIDPASGQVLPEATDGELVITTLTREALPLIRYRTRDLTQLMPPTSRPMRRIARIAGRLDDRIVMGSSSFLPGQIEELILKQEALAPHYQLELLQEGRADLLIVHTEPTATAASDRAVRERVAATLRESIRAATGVAAQIRVGEPGTVERSKGRAQRVIDKRPPGAAARS